MDPTARALFARYDEVTMPNLGLGPEDVAAIIDHLDRLGARSAAR